MAAEIRPFPGASGPQKLQLASKLEGHQDVVNAAVILKGEDGVISISDDKSVPPLLLLSRLFTAESVSTQDGAYLAQARRRQLLAKCLSHHAW